MIIPANVSYFEKNAMENCTKLTTVYYTGTPAQWFAIKYEEGNDVILGADLVYTSKEALKNEAERKAVADLNAANAVIRLIKDFPDEIEEKDIQSVTKAKNAYDQLTQEQKDLIDLTLTTKLRVASYKAKLLQEQKQAEEKNKAAEAKEKEAADAKVSAEAKANGAEAAKKDAESKLAAAQAAQKTAEEQAADAKAKVDEDNDSNTKASSSNKQTKTTIGKVSIKSIKANKKQMTIKWKKVMNASAYRVTYRKNGVKKWNYKNTSKLNVKIKKLKSKTKYSVKVQGVKDTTYGKWSSVKTVKVK